MRYRTNIHKIKEEKTQKKHEEIREIDIKRNMKSHITTRPKDLPASRES